MTGTVRRRRPTAMDGKTLRNTCPWKRQYAKKWCVTCNRLLSIARTHPINSGITFKWCRRITNQASRTCSKCWRLIRPQPHPNPTKWRKVRKLNRPRPRNPVSGRSWPWGKTNGDSILNGLEKKKKEKKREQQISWTIICTASSVTIRHLFCWMRWAITEKKRKQQSSYFWFILQNKSKTYVLWHIVRCLKRQSWPKFYRKKKERITKTTKWNL